jgi:hypothetical protein
MIFDDQHADELRSALVAAITETSKVSSDPDAPLVLRTAEITSLCSTCWPLVICLSPSEVRSPTAIPPTDRLPGEAAAPARRRGAGRCRRRFTGGRRAGSKTPSYRATQPALARRELSLVIERFQALTDTPEGSP